MVVESAEDEGSDRGVVVKVNKKTVWVRWKEVFDEEQADKFLQKDFPLADLKAYAKEAGIKIDDKARKAALDQMK